jgi:hypothetical protein
VVIDISVEYRDFKLYGSGSIAGVHELLTRVPWSGVPASRNHSYYQGYLMHNCGQLTVIAKECIVSLQ